MLLSLKWNSISCFEEVRDRIYSIRFYYFAPKSENLIEKTPHCTFNCFRIVQKNIGKGIQFFGRVVAFILEISTIRGTRGGLISKKNYWCDCTSTTKTNVLINLIIKLQFNMEDSVLCSQKWKFNWKKTARWFHSWVSTIKRDEPWNQQMTLPPFLTNYVVLY